jgi:hypothetical protein
MPAEYVYRAIYLKCLRGECYGNVTRPETQAGGPCLAPAPGRPPDQAIGYDTTK